MKIVNVQLFQKLVKPYLEQYLSCGIQTWHDGRLIHGRVDDLVSSGSAKAKNQC